MNKNSKIIVSQGISASICESSGIQNNIKEIKKTNCFALGKNLNYFVFIEKV
jgi:hypothetical protein